MGRLTERFTVMIPELSVEIHHSVDHWGSIHVLEHQGIRYLTFGDGGEQSAVDLEQPHIPLYEYTQAMLLALIFHPHPNQIVLLGLGGGSLATALLHNLPTTSQITAVELRAQVACAAQDWFQLPNDPRLTVEIEDAGHYMAKRSKSCDLLFADIYLDEGMQKVQLSEELLGHCERLLTDEGVLVLNLWDEGHGCHPLALERLSGLFGGQLLACPIIGGNLVLFASKAGLELPNPRHLQQPLKRLSKRSGDLPLQELFNRLRPLSGW